MHCWTFKTAKLTSQFHISILKAFTSKWRYLFFPRATLVVLIHWFLFLLRSAAPAQTTSPEHLTGSEGPTGANSIQKGTQSFSCIRFISAMNISFGSRVSGAVVCPDERGERRWGECVWMGWGWGGVSAAVSWETTSPPFQGASHREYALSHLVPQRDPGAYSCRPAPQSFLEVV